MHHLGHLDIVTKQVFLPIKSRKFLIYSTIIYVDINLKKCDRIPILYIVVCNQISPIYSLIVHPDVSLSKNQLGKSCGFWRAVYIFHSVHLILVYSIDESLQEPSNNTLQLPIYLKLSSPWCSLQMQLATAK